jgi:hypothetical protein
MFMSLSSTIATSDDAVADVVAALERVDFDAETSDASIRKIVAAAVKLYSYKVQRDGGIPAIDAGAITPTDAMIACTALLRGVNVQVFELGCWQGWMG